MKAAILALGLGAASLLVGVGYFAYQLWGPVRPLRLPATWRPIPDDRTTNYDLTD